LVQWLVEQGLLRGPYLYLDYWSSVLGLRVPGTRRREREGRVDTDLFRLGLDRPDLELPRLRHYLLLFLVGPFLLPFRAFRRLGRYRLDFRSEIGREVLGRLRAFRLELAERDAAEGGGTPAGDDAGPGHRRVDVRLDGETLVEDVLHPHDVAGFASLFHATYKLPLASLTAIVLVGLLAPALHAAPGPAAGLDLWGPVGFPVLAGLLYLVWRDWVTAVLGALPVVVARYLFLPLLGPSGTGDWTAFLVALAGLFVVYLGVDWFFMPRPVPPVLQLYADEGPGRPYDRPGDAPWWLEGETYWVWRYLVLTPAEINKFWERDWERVELWIRADGPDAGALEWVVTDAHYREVWIPYEKLGRRDRLGRQRARARSAAEEGRAGFWLLEADADPLFHTPFMRAVSFVPEEERFPVRSVGHMLSALWKQAESDDPDRFREAVERAELRLGAPLFGDTPEAASGLVARHLLSQPWRYWRYPRGARTMEEPLLYGERERRPSPPAADPALQVKETTEDLK
jgi:hypothetical protein